jgi:L-asparaginase II
VNESHLLCGTHPLSHTPTVEAMRQRGEDLTPNRHNCSGKHSGMLAYTHLKGLPLVPTDETPAYTDPCHPVQQEILGLFAEMCALSPEEVSLGVDGCSVPNFAGPLYNAAFGFARLCDPHGLSERRADACRTITSSMTAHPFMVGGPNSFDTHLMTAAGGKIVCKGGAEGYLIMGFMPGLLEQGAPGVGIAIKISDGDLGGRARPGSPSFTIRPAVALEILRQLGVLTSSEIETLQNFGPGFTVYNWRKIKAGNGRPCFTLQTL